MADVNESKMPPRWALFGAVVFIALALLTWIAYYLLVGQYFVSTDDAYLAADSSLIAAKVGGYVTEVAVDNGQAVKPGQLLVVIDPRDYQNALAAAKAEAANEEAALVLQQAKIAAAKAAVQGDEARLAFAVHQPDPIRQTSPPRAPARSRRPSRPTPTLPPRAPSSMPIKPICRPPSPRWRC